MAEASIQYTAARPKMHAFRHGGPLLDENVREERCADLAQASYSVTTNWAAPPRQSAAIPEAVIETPAEAYGGSAIGRLVAAGRALEDEYSAAVEADDHACEERQDLMDRADALFKQAETMPATSVADAADKVRHVIERLEHYAYSNRYKVALTTALAALDVLSSGVPSRCAMRGAIADVDAARRAHEADAGGDGGPNDGPFQALIAAERRAAATPAADAAGLLWKLENALDGGPAPEEVAQYVESAMLAGLLADLRRLAGRQANDAELAERVDTFRKLYEVAIEGRAAWHKYRAEREATLPDGVRVASDAWSSHVLTAEHDAACDRAVEAMDAAGKAARALFKVPARTVRGLVLKLQVYRLAYGERPGTICDVGDDDLAAFNESQQWLGETEPNGDRVYVPDPEWRPWLDTIIEDAGRLADGGAL